MGKKRAIIVGVAAGAAALAALAWAVAGADDGRLGIADVSETRGVTREDKLFDGKVPDPGYSINDFVAALFLGPEALIVFRIDADAPVRWVRIAGNADAFTLATSTDGGAFAELPIAGATSNGAFVGTAEIERPAAFLKIALRPGVPQGAAYELVALPRAPTAAGALWSTQSPPTYYEAVDQELRRLARTRVAKVGVAALALVALLLAWRAGEGRRRALHLALFAIGVAAFVQFKNPVGELHAWEVAHYYLGAKYAPELGYARLYDALIYCELANGRGRLLEGKTARSLETYALAPIALDPEDHAAAVARFDRRRLAEFSRDWDLIRMQFGFRKPTGLFTDHGYNGSPLYTAIFGSLFRLSPPTEAFLSAVAAADLLLLICGLLLLLRAYGSLAGAIAALTVGLGEPWSYLWTGGALGRYLWFFLLCLSLYLVRRRRHLAGGVAMALAALLRIFPAAFAAFAVAQLALAGGAATLRARLRYVAGLGVGIAAGAALALAAVPTAVVAEFAGKMQLHAANESANRIALAPLAAVLAPAGWERPAAVALILLVAAASAVVLVAWVRRGFPEALSHVLAGLMILIVFPLSSYDYLWIAALAPAISASRLRTALLAAFLAASCLLSDSFLSQESAFLLTNAAVAAFLALVAVSCVLAARRAPPQGEGVRGG